MNPDELFALLVVIVLVAGFVFARRRHHAGPTAQAGDEAARLRDEVRQLRERVQVLERVVIDSHPAVDLDRRIERLRDQ